MAIKIVARIKKVFRDFTGRMDCSGGANDTWVCRRETDWLSSVIFEYFPQAFYTIMDRAVKRDRKVGFRRDRE